MGSSIGIIGGADGPTAILISESSSLVHIILPIAVIIAAAFVIGIIITAVKRR